MSHAVPALLIVEDDPDAAALLHETLVDHFGEDRCEIVERVGEALGLDVDDYDLVLADLNLPDGSGLELITAMLGRRPDLPVVMVTSESGLDVAMEAIRRGAYDYVVKVGDYLFTVPLVVEKNLEVWRTKQDNARLEGELKDMLGQLQERNDQLREAVAKLEAQAATDPLTGLANRREIKQQLERAFAESQRYATDLTCVMIDLDRFKQLNDTLGHQRGDELLRAAARVLTANCRRSDVAGRYGGDEFVLLLPQTDPTTAARVAGRIQREFREAAQASLPAGRTANMSLGLACVSRHRPATADQLVALADAALYQAKQAGKGRIKLHGAAAQPGPSAATVKPAAQA